MPFIVARNEIVFPPQLCRAYWKIYRTDAMVAACRERLGTDSIIIPTVLWKGTRITPSQDFAEILKKEFMPECWRFMDWINTFGIVPVRKKKKKNGKHQINVISGTFGVDFTITVDSNDEGITFFFSASYIALTYSLFFLF
jgi:hypothetical protein